MDRKYASILCSAVFFVTTKDPHTSSPLQPILLRRGELLVRVLVVLFVIISTYASSLPSKNKQRNSLNHFSQHWFSLVLLFLLMVSSDYASHSDPFSARGVTHNDASMPLTSLPTVLQPTHLHQCGQVVRLSKLPLGANLRGVQELPSLFRVSRPSATPRAPPTPSSKLTQYCTALAKTASQGTALSHTLPRFPIGDAPTQPSGEYVGYSHVMGETYWMKMKIKI